MSGLASQILNDTEVRERIKRKCKKAPAAISTFSQAYKAWGMYHRYLDLAHMAYTRYFQSGMGSNPQRFHSNRWQAYEAVADEWKKVLEDYLREHARIGREK